jgi:hypothetical protein
MSARVRRRGRGRTRAAWPAPHACLVVCGAHGEHAAGNGPADSPDGGPKILAEGHRLQQAHRQANTTHVSVSAATQPPGNRSLLTQSECAACCSKMWRCPSCPQLAISEDPKPRLGAQATSRTQSADSTGPRVHGRKPGQDIQRRGEPRSDTGMPLNLMKRAHDPITPGPNLDGRVAAPANEPQRLGATIVALPPHPPSTPRHRVTAERDEEERRPTWSAEPGPAGGAQLTQVTPDVCARSSCDSHWSSARGKGPKGANMHQPLGGGEVGPTHACPGR